MSLKDTLASLQRQEQENARWEEDKPNIISEWQKSVAALITDIRAYLEEYQESNAMHFLENDIELTEEMLGRYRVKQLSITAGPVMIFVQPIGRMIIGAMGRVDIFRQGRIRDEDRIVLLRVPTSQTDSTLQWVTKSPPETGTPLGIPNGCTLMLQHERIFVPLNKEILEQKLDLLLR